MSKKRIIKAPENVQGEAVALLKKYAGGNGEFKNCPWAYRAYALAVLSKFAKLTDIDPLLPGSRGRVTPEPPPDPEVAPTPADEKAQALVDSWK